MTRHLKKTIALIALVGAFTLAQTATSEAAFIAYICNDQACSGGDDLSATDGDNDGVITLIPGGGYHGYEFVLNVSQSKPALGNGMDLNYVVSNSSNGVLGPIWLYAVDTDFNGPALIKGVLGGTAPAGTTTTAYICGGDSNVGSFSPCSSDSVLATQSEQHVDLDVTHFASADPYALAIGVMIDTLPVGHTASGDFRVEAAPEPASMALFGLGLAGFASYRRRRQMQ